MLKLGEKGAIPQKGRTTYAIAYYTENANKGERLGKMIERIGLDALKAASS